MAHKTLKTAYSQLADRINQFPQGAPPSELLFKILKMLFSEREALLVSQIPLRPFTADKAAEIWNLEVEEAREILIGLCRRGMMVDIENDDISYYVLPPPMAGFFEFSLMRTGQEVDQKALSELFYQYLNEEEDFVRELFTRGDTQLGRTFVHEPALSAENALHVLDYERASEVIKTASHRAIGTCYCRHKMEHMGRACGAPLDICMTFNNSARSLSKHGCAKEVSVKECLEQLDRAYDHGLVQFGENCQTGVNFICNCCGCCCEAMIAARRFAMLNPVHTTNFIPKIASVSCNGCGKCVAACPVEAMTLVSANDPNRTLKKRAKLVEEICLGCAVCVRACPQESIHLESREKRILTPTTSTHKVVQMAIERGTLQNLIFDKQVLSSHRALGSVLGAILKLKPVERLLANEQLKSHYLGELLKKLQV